MSEDTKLYDNKKHLKVIFLIPVMIFQVSWGSHLTGFKEKFRLIPALTLKWDENYSDSDH